MAGMSFPLNFFWSTPQKSKEVLKNSKLLYSIVLNYKKSGNSSMQCADDDDELEKV